jgi:hypothetical protein
MRKIRRRDSKTKGRKGDERRGRKRQLRDKKGGQPVER